MLIQGIISGLAFGSGTVGVFLVGRYIRQHRAQVADTFGIFFLFAFCILLAINGFFGLLFLLPLPR